MDTMHALLAPTAVAVVGASRLSVMVAILSSTL